MAKLSKIYTGKINDHPVDLFADPDGGFCWFCGTDLIAALGLSETERELCQRVLAPFLGEVKTTFRGDEIVQIFSYDVAADFLSAMVELELAPQESERELRFAFVKAFCSQNAHLPPEARFSSIFAAAASRAGKD